MNDYTTILNCKLHNVTKEELLEKFTSGVLMPTNVDMVMKMQKDRDFYGCFNDAEFRVNDSQVLRFASIFLGHELRDTVCGSDFFPMFYLHYRDKRDVTIFLLGAKEGIAHEAMERINNRTGRRMVVGCYSPPFGFEKDEVECRRIVDMINASEATVLAIGLGAPKQEKWAFLHKRQLRNVSRILCIGATIDFEAGKISRAPKILRKIGLEWMYRLFQEPNRLWKRYLIHDFPFIWLLLKQRLGIYKNPFNGKK